MSERIGGGILTVSHDEAGDGQMTPATARVKTAELRGALGRLADALGEAHALVLEVWAGRADIALGHPTWTDYCVTRLGDVRSTRWPPATRRAVAEDLRVHGMSYRAIAAVLGIDQRTAREDCADLEPARQPARVTGTDRKSHAGRHLAAVPAPPPAQPEVVVPPPPGPAAAPERRPAHTLLALAAIRAAGPAGMTSREVGEAFGWHHGQSSALCTALVASGRVAVAESKRERYRVLVVPAGTQAPQVGVEAVEAAL